MNLAAYFARIGYTGTARVDHPTLCAVHRSHATSIPFENLDIQLGRPVTTAPEAAFDKNLERHLRDGNLDPEHAPPIGYAHLTGIEMLGRDAKPPNRID